MKPPTVESPPASSVPEIDTPQAKRYREGRTFAVLDATLALLGEIGYDALTMDAVAARARASKSTIYRRWSDKRELVLAALERAGQAVPSVLADAGNLRDDLLALLAIMQELSAGEGSAVLFSSLLYAAQRDKVIADALRDQLVEGRRDDCASVIERAVQRGELQQRVPSDLLFDLIRGQMMMRTLVYGESPDDDFARDLIDNILMPVLAEYGRSAENHERT